MMLIFEKSENTKSFKKYITDINCKEVVPMSQAIYNCLKLFNQRYGNIPSWKKSVSDQNEWFTYLNALAKDHSEKELSRKLPVGSSNGIYMVMLFFKAVAMNEGTQVINAMSDYIEKFNRIGHHISHDVDSAETIKPHDFSLLKRPKAAFEARAAR